MIVSILTNQNAPTSISPPRHPRTAHDPRHESKKRSGKSFLSIPHALCCGPFAWKSSSIDRLERSPIVDHSRNRRRFTRIGPNMTVPTCTFSLLDVKLTPLATGHQRLVNAGHHGICDQSGGFFVAVKLVFPERHLVLADFLDLGAQSTRDLPDGLRVLRRDARFHDGRKRRAWGHGEKSSEKLVDLHCRDVAVMKSLLRVQ